MNIPELIVDAATVRDPHHQHSNLVVFDFAYHPIVADSVAPVSRERTRQRLAA